MSKLERINFESPYREQFKAKADVERGSMTVLLNEWIEAYLRNDLYTRKDVEIILSAVLVELGMADRVKEVDSLINKVLEKSYEKLELSRSAITGELSLPPGRLLRKIRKEKSMSIRAAAAAVSDLLGKPYPWQNVSRLEAQAGTPRRETIEPLLTVYGYTYEQFMDRLEKER